jgi:hypothetical protein
MDNPDDTSSAALLPPPSSLAATVADAMSRAAARAARFGGEAPSSAPVPTLSFLRASGVTATTEELTAAGVVFSADGGGSAVDSSGGAGGGARQRRAPREPAEMTVSGLNPFSAEERAKQTARAAKFGGAVFDPELERARQAGLPEDAVRLRQLQRANAAKFGTEAPLDRDEAVAALAALGPVWEDVAAGPLPPGYEMPERPALEGGEGGAPAMDGEGAALDGAGAAAAAAPPPPPPPPADLTTLVATEGADPMAAEAPVPASEGVGGAAGPAEPRPGVLHLRTWKYLPANNNDILEYFLPLRARRVEWLNSVSVNVHFADADTAARALETMGGPVPRVATVPPVHPAWRFAPKRFVKKTPDDKYGPRGSETSVWIRQATTHDTKALAKSTHGAFCGSTRPPPPPPRS